MLGRIPWLALALTACTATHDPRSDVDAGLPAADDAGGVDSPGAFMPDTEYLDAYAGPVLAACGGVTCAEGEVCCLIDHRCVTPHDPSCAPPAGSPPGSCASAADCSTGQVCIELDARGNPAWARCGGVGTCWTIAGTCSGGSGVCGCDGRTYTNDCVAWAAGVGVAAEAACGQPLLRGNDSCGSGCPHGSCDASTNVCVFDDLLYACGRDADCPPGQTCCTVHGLCLGPTDRGLCGPVPDGAIIGCNDDRDCERFDGSWWEPRGPSLFCDGPSCTGPGGCVSPMDSCPGTLAPVCGCDGNTYQNRCEASRASVRVAHTGNC
jgi:hypothetical protein